MEQAWPSRVLRRAIELTGTVTILVDEARWQWRGLRWAHLVSDDSYEELHRFARALGKRRLGFQGDHYDVEEIDRERAVVLGAVAVGSRELVRRLRAADLRERSKKPEWMPTGEWPIGTRLDPVSPQLDRAVQDAGLDGTLAHARLLADPRHVALLLDFSGEHEVPPSARLWVTGRRVDGSWSAEFFLGKSGLTPSPDR